MAWTFFSEGQKIVGDHAETNDELAPFAFPVDWNGQLDSVDQVRCEVTQAASLVQRLEDERNLSVFEITKATVNEPAGITRTCHYQSHFSRGV